MRNVEIRRAYATLDARGYSSALNSASVSVTNVSGDESNLSIEFSSGVSVLTGGNGAGKTTLLQAIHSALAVGVASAEVTWPSRINQVTLSGRVAGEPWAVSVNRPDGVGEAVTATTQGAAPAEFHYIDAAADTQALLAILSRDNNAQDFLSGLDPSAMSREWVDRLAYILRRDYEDVLVFEAEDPESPESPLPLFSFTSNGVNYPTQKSGRGELSAAYLVWRLSQIPDNSFVIVEEPENHLAAASQSALMDVLVELSANSGICFLLSSHSPEMFQKLTDGRVVLVNSAPNLEATNGMASRHVARQLGLRMRLALVLLAEDVAAAHLMAVILKQTDPALLDAVDVWFSKDGESGVRSVVDRLDRIAAGSSGLASVPLIALLDGDQRSAPNGGQEYLYLPGSLAPELNLKAIATRWRAGQLQLTAPVIGDEAGLLDAITNSAGLDEHDWLFSIANSCGGMYAALMALVSVAMSDGEFARQSEELVSGIRVAIS